MPVVSVRDKNDPKISEIQIMDIIHKVTGIYFRGFRTNLKGYAAYLENSEDKAKLLDPVNRELISREGIEVIKPPDYRAACTIIISGAGSSYRVLGEEILKKEIEEAIGTKISYMTVFGDKVRLELNSPEEAKRILEVGEIETENVHFLELEKQRFARVPQCSRCYSYAHERADCPSREQLCFICAEPGHDDVACTRKDNPKCRNCHQDHVAIAFKCPFRRVRLFELDERSDCDLEALILVDHMRRILGEKSPSSSDEESSEAEGAVAAPYPSSIAEGAVAAPYPSSSGEGTESGATGGEPSAAPTPLFEVNVGALRTMVMDTLESILKKKTQRPTDMTDDEEKPWKTVRVLKAPEPEKGEGPNRRCRKIENFKPPVLEPSAPLTFPVLPPRPLRKIAAA